MTWTADPQCALWRGVVIFEAGDGRTDYVYGYSAATEEPDPLTILPVRHSLRIVESRVEPTSHLDLEGTLS